MSDSIVLTNDDNTIIVINYPITTIFHSPPLHLLPTSHLFPLAYLNPGADRKPPLLVRSINPTIAHKSSTSPQFPDPRSSISGDRAVQLLPHHVCQNYVFEGVERGDKRELQKHVRVYVTAEPEKWRPRHPPGPRT